MGRYYRRHLPHGAPDDSAVFITWNLKGALPREALEQIRRIREQFDPDKHDDPEYAKREVVKQVFRISENFLDQAQNGPVHLKNPRNAEIVTRSILDGANTYYELLAFVVMSNHVHMLFRPFVHVERIAGGIKQSTARKINQLMNRIGQPFWQDESFDHRPRNREALLKFSNYIEQNPVKAGLCNQPEDWVWSSAAMRSNWP